MIYCLYSVKDELSDYASPLPFIDEENAKRYFRTQLEENNFMKNNKKDFSLWNMGLFDSESGSIFETKCELVERGPQKNGNEKDVL